MCGAVPIGTFQEDLVGISENINCRIYLCLILPLISPALKIIAIKGQEITMKVGLGSAICPSFIKTRLVNWEYLQRCNEGN